MCKPWRASQQAVLPESWLEFLPWLLFMVKYKMYAEISPFFPKLPVVMWFITLESKLWHQVSPTFLGWEPSVFLRTKMTAISCKISCKNHSTVEKWLIHWLLTFVLLDFSGSSRPHFSVIEQELTCGPGAETGKSSASQNAPQGPGSVAATTPCILQDSNTMLTHDPGLAVLLETEALGNLSTTLTLARFLNPNSWMLLIQSSAASDQVDSSVGEILFCRSLCCKITSVQWVISGP